MTDDGEIEMPWFVAYAELVALAAILVLTAAAACVLIQMTRTN